MTSPLPVALARCLLRPARRVRPGRCREHRLRRTRGAGGGGGLAPRRRGRPAGRVRAAQLGGRRRACRGSLDPRRARGPHGPRRLRRVAGCERLCGLLPRARRRALGRRRPVALPPQRRPARPYPARERSDHGRVRRHRVPAPGVHHAASGRLARPRLLRGRRRHPRAGGLHGRGDPLRRRPVALLPSARARRAPAARGPRGHGRAGGRRGPARRDRRRRVGRDRAYRRRRGRARPQGARRAHRPGRRRHRPDAGDASDGHAGRRRQRGLRGVAAPARTHEGGEPGHPLVLPHEAAERRSDRVHRGRRPTRRSWARGTGDAVSGAAGRSGRGLHRRRRASSSDRTPTSGAPSSRVSAPSRTSPPGRWSACSASTRTPRCGRSPSPAPA